MQNVRWTQAHTHILTHTHSELLLAYKIQPELVFSWHLCNNINEINIKNWSPCKILQHFVLFSPLNSWERSSEWLSVCGSRNCSSLSQKYMYVSNFTSLHYIFIPTVYKYYYKEFSHTLNHVDWWTISSCMYMYHIINKKLTIFFFLFF